MLILLNFRNDKGLIILKAFYGKKEKIFHILSKEKKKVKYLKEIGELDNLINENENEKGHEYNENDIFSEILDVKDVIQYFVRNSVLQIKLENFKKIPGIFNPCIEENANPFLLIK